MGKRGPITTEAKRASEARKSESPRVLKPSVYLSPLAKKYWKVLVASFPSGHFSESDRVLLEQFCVAAALHQEATIFLDTPTQGGASARYVTDRYDKVVLHPAVKDQHQARCDCAMLATKLRITKTSMISPKAVGRAAQEATEEKMVYEQFGDLLYSGARETRQ